MKLDQSMNRQERVVGSPESVRSESDTTVPASGVALQDEVHGDKLDEVPVNNVTAYRSHTSGHVMSVKNAGTAMTVPVNMTERRNTQQLQITDQK